MNILLLGAAGFIGTNLALRLAESDNKITLADSKWEYFSHFPKEIKNKVCLVELLLNEKTDFKNIMKGQDIVYHLVSTTTPNTSNQQIASELTVDIALTVKILDSCVENGVKKIVFISSGGAVYGKDGNCPLGENVLTNPISSYGIQKVAIEKILYLYNYLHKLDYRIVRLANPYGPYQRPNGLLGAVTTFTYQALHNEVITIYGDGSVVRDFIYIDDAVSAILKITEGNSEYKIFNVGCGYGTSIKDVLTEIGNVLKKELKVRYMPGRKVDIPINYLDISRYENEYGRLLSVPLNQGIARTARFLEKMSMMGDAHL